ncbi:MAG: alpha-amylase family glycosyl hydrolase, partial [Betaproteobacteria bacterium]
AEKHGIRVILDGVFNHMSSDSPLFDRYHHYSTIGACESTTSAYRSWFTFHEVGAGNGTCAGAAGPDSATYDGWFGFDSIPVLTKSLPAVQQYFLTSSDAVAKHWLAAGASGWRLDVAGDASFPDGYWQTFRSVVKTANPSALTISETWQKDSTLLRALRGDRFDTTMNYRFRDAVLAYLAPQAFDSKGFADSGHHIPPSAFLSRLASIREDYPDAAYFSAMNLLDSHDTERLLWTLTPGAATTADKELNATNLMDGKARVRLASLIQFTIPGAPTVYYGDEVGQTGADDPDDRRTYPWSDLGGSPDMAMYAHYRNLAALRKSIPALTAGDFRPLLADDANGVAAYGRKTGSNAAIVVTNDGPTPQTVDVPVAGYLPDGVSFSQRDPSGGGSVSTGNGRIVVSVPALGGVLLATDTVDLTAPAAPTGLHVTSEGNGQLSVAWNAVGSATGYNVYTSPITGGGYVKQNDAPVTGTSFDILGLPNAKAAFVVVTAVDAAGNESAWSNEVSGTPHLTIGWANLQWPPTMTYTISAISRTDTAYGQVRIDGVTNQPGPTPTLLAQLGFGPAGSNPDGNADWTWVDASFNVDAGDNDEFKASMQPETVGTFDYLYRYTTTGGGSWLYADLNGPIPAGSLPPNPGKLTVNPSDDTTPPSVPTGLHVVSAGPGAVDLAWDANSGDATLYGYEVGRSDTSGGPYTVVGLTTGTDLTDSSVVQGATYFYAVRAVDQTFNRSAYSDEVQAIAQLRTVTLTFNVTVPATTDGTGRSVHIAGFLDRLDGGYPQWDPTAAPLTQVDSTHWTITFTGQEFTQLEYKYALGDWLYVEKDASCGEIGNRQLTLAYGSDGTQTVNDTVLNWRNVAPCGN